MFFNATKTKYMVVTNRRYPPNQTTLKLNNTDLERVTSLKQLGLLFDERMTWQPHIEQLILKSNKKIGLIWQISNQFPRSCAETIYTSYIRPILDYACICYDNCSVNLNQRLEVVQRKAALACTRAIRRTPTKDLLAELGWSTLETRRKYFRLVQLHRIKNNLTPPYLRTLLPPLMGQHANRPTQYRHNYTAPRSNRRIYHSSFIPRTTRDWNDLDERLKELPTSNSFKHNLKKNLVPTKMQLYSRSRGRNAVNHTRMRIGLSGLRQQLNGFGIIDNPYCEYCAGTLETVTHYLMSCPLYVGHRAVMLEGVRAAVETCGITLDLTDYRLLVGILLRGNITYTNQVNMDIFKFVQEFIGNSRRF